MQKDITNLFVEINDKHYIFLAGKYDDNQNFKIDEKIITLNNGIENNKFVNIDEAREEIKKNVQLIESKVNYTFKNVTLIIDSFRLSSINISGYKKLNGSQILKENISYILNSLKSSIAENEKNKTILHIFNSKSILDNVHVENLPIGLFGDFYSHELSFLLIHNNDLKNIKQIFNKNNLKVEKIFIKNFIEGTKLIENDNSESFFRIKINKNNSTINFFENSSLRFLESFSFGTNIIKKDILKICSIKLDTIERILSDNIFENYNYSDDEEHLEKEYFFEDKYRKIRKKLLVDIAIARIEEIAKIILNNNTSAKFFQNKSQLVYLTIEDKLISNNFKSIFKSFFSKDYDFEINLIDEYETESLVLRAAHLINYGWKKEAIPVSQTKNSLITRIFKSLFE
tara:strand:+ start:5505 stop:6704 length:1200 start_codon:yes stop_codon:yes gene_type:complete